MKLPSKKLFNRAYGNFAYLLLIFPIQSKFMDYFPLLKKCKAPFIIQTTPAAREYAHPIMLLNYIKSAAQIYPDVVFAVHVDHGYESHIHNAINSNEYTSVMIDASHDDIEKKY